MYSLGQLSSGNDISRYASYQPVIVSKYMIVTRSILCQSFSSEMGKNVFDF